MAVFNIDTNNNRGGGRRGFGGRRGGIDGQIVPTFQVPTLDLDTLSDLGTTLNKTKEQEYEEVVTGLDQLSNLQDDITKIRIDNPEQQQVLDRALNRVGVTQDSFNFSREDFRDPNKTRNLQRSLIKLSNQPEVRQLVTDQTFADSFEQNALNIDKLSLKTKALQQLKDYKEGKISARELDPGKYKSIDSDKALKGFLSELDSTLSARINEGISNGSFTGIDLIESKTSQAVNGALSDLMNNENFVLNLMDDKNLNSPEEVKKYLEQYGKRYTDGFVKDIQIKNNPAGGGSGGMNSQQYKELQYRRNLGKIIDVLNQNGKTTDLNQLLEIGDYDSATIGVNPQTGKEVIILTDGTSQTFIPIEQNSGEPLQNPFAQQDPKQQGPQTPPQTNLPTVSKTGQQPVVNVTTENNSSNMPNPNTTMKSKVDSPAGRNNNPLNIREVGSSSNKNSSQTQTQGKSAVSDFFSN